MRLLHALLAAAVTTTVAAAPSAMAQPADLRNQTPTASSAPADATARVIVQAHDQASAAAAVRDAGGTITLDLPIVDGFAATVPAAALDALAQHTSIRQITADETVSVAETTSTTNETTLNHVLVREIGADQLHAAGINGTGVGVAVIDTGITAAEDLRGRIKPVADPHQPVASWRTTVDCVDLSGEGTCADTYGHGTFMGGLIAGDGRASAGKYTGVAPGAHLVSIKIGGRDGSADVSKLLAAIQWTVSFKDDHNIRVLNLSLGTNSTASPQTDPLNYAVQRAWRSGLVVVVAASNRGPAAATISKPADDPLVITVGAIDDRESPATSDDRIPSFSGRGPTAHGLAKPDIVAPGGRVVSLRAPGSLIDESAPALNNNYRRGSGTSMSAAVVSGAAALLVQAHPDWTPDRIKYALLSTATKVADSDPLLVGRGLVYLPAANTAGPGLANTDVTLLSDGSGSLDASRGDVRVAQTCPLTGGTCSPSGNETANGTTFDADAYTGTEWTGQSWYSSPWVNPLGQSWYSSTWLGQSWYGQSWYGSSWYGNSDDSISYGTPVPGSAWYGAWG